MKRYSINSNACDPFSRLKAFKKALIVATFLAAVGTVTASSALGGQSQDNSQSPAAPDNSGQNKAPGSTADQQGNRESDTAITRQIRESVVADKSLSMYAHNVKIITRHGVVTLKGPVKSEDEKQVIANKAEAVVGSADMVKNDLTVDNSGK
jgi:hyperosmotically inducible periplasmic protein